LPLALQIRANLAPALVFVTNSNSIQATIFAFTIVCLQAATALSLLQVVHRVLKISRVIAPQVRCWPPQGFIEASFVSTGSIPIGMDKYNKKIMIETIRDPDLFRVEN
jgi:hypothetical protein